jgi:hypothetical protein
VVHILAAVENDFLDAGFGSAFGEKLANFRGGVLGAALDRALQAFINARRGGKRLAVFVLDDLGVDVPARTEHRQARAAVRRCLDGETRTALAARGLFESFGHDLIPLSARFTSSCLLCAG